MKTKTLDLLIHFCFESPRHELETLQEIVDTVEDHFQQEQQRMADWVEREAEKIESDDKQNFYDAYLDDIVQYESDFPSRVRRSFLVSQWSVFEAFITRLCDLLKDRLSLDGSYEDEDRGSVMKKATRYLKNVGGLEFDTEDSVWSELLLIQRVRHQIVHSRARAGVSDQDLIRRLGHHDNYGLGTTNQIMLKATAHAAVREILVQAVGRIQTATKARVAT